MHAVEAARRMQEDFGVRNVIVIDDNVRQSIPADFRTRPITLPSGRPKLGQADVTAYEVVS